MSAADWPCSIPLLDVHCTDPDVLVSHLFDDVFHRDPAPLARIQIVSLDDVGERTAAQNPLRNRADSFRKQLIQVRLHEAVRHLR